MPEAPNLAEQKPLIAPARVLVIDDEPGLRQMLLFSLQKRGYEVACAANGAEALTLAAEKPIDVAVCDVMMPGQNGIEVLSILKSRYPTMEIIIATGYATLETAIEAMKNGAFDYITKPYRMSHLCTLLDKALEHKHLLATVNHLEEVNRLKTEFMNTVNHELRTPLASITGYVALLLKGIYGPLPEKSKGILDRVQTNANSLLELINNILDLSKLSAEKMPISIEMFDLDELIKEVVEAMEPLAKSKQLTIKFDVPARMTVSADRTKLKQIMINLMGNAVKFTPSGSVTLSAQKDNKPGMVELRVKDTGIGIADKDIPLLFQEFRQLDSSDRRLYKGTGLGLAISKKLVDLMKGTIVVESIPKVGTTFIVQLPLLEVPPQAAAVAARPQEFGADDKIILGIDDDPDILKILSDSLAGTEYRFVGVSNGREGLERARALRPYAITLDVMMPHMDGWSVFKALKHDPVLKNTPVYIVSIVDNKALGLSLGVTGYLMKPFTREDLFGVLKIASKPPLCQVLVVDDDPKMGTAFSKTLSEGGYEVQVATSGEQAIERLKQVRPDVLFLDLAMPGVSGFDVLDEMGRNAGLESVTVFVMSEKELTREQGNYLEKRVAHVLQKRSTDINRLLKEAKEKLEALQKKVA
jgi:signal transduction histidine kinase